MKKLLFLFLSAITIILTLTGCGGNKTDDMTSKVTSDVSSIVDNTKSMLDGNNGNVSSNAH